MPELNDDVRGHRRRHALHRAATTSGPAGRPPRTRTGSCTSRTGTACRRGSSTAPSIGFATRRRRRRTATARRSRSSNRPTRASTGCTAGAWIPRRGWQVMDECGIHAQVLFPNARRARRPQPQQRRPGRDTPDAVHRDLQRRHGRDAGRVEPALHPDAGHAGVGRRPVRQGDRAVRRARPPRAST